LRLEVSILRWLRPELGYCATEEEEEEEKEEKGEEEGGLCY
jgi:hypothetical protein